MWTIKKGNIFIYTGKVLYRGYIGLYRLFSKLWALLGYKFYNGTLYLGIPEWDPDFGNYPKP